MREIAEAKAAMLNATPTLDPARAAVAQAKAEEAAVEA